MTISKLSKDEKHIELQKYRDLNLATLDYYLDNKEMHLKTADFDSQENYKRLKNQIEVYYLKGQLTRLKQCFREMTEMQVEASDLKFNKYLQDKTKYDVDIFKSYFQRIESVLQKGKITTDNQFYDISIMVDHLCQTDPAENEKIQTLNKLLNEYEQRRSK
jgi:hypothetical protein